MAASKSKETKKNQKLQKKLTLESKYKSYEVLPAVLGLEKNNNTKSKCSYPGGTTGLFDPVVLLLLLQHKSSQHLSTFLGPKE